MQSFSRADPQLNDPHYLKMVADFPDFYQSNGSFLRCVAEFGRLVKRMDSHGDVKPVEFMQIFSDMTSILASGCEYDMIDKRFNMRIDFGEFGQKHFDAFVKAMRDGDMESVQRNLDEGKKEG